jgi:16S rRNA (guanine1516-N2)-methyltransferase
LSQKLGLPLYSEGLETKFSFFLSVGENISLEVNEEGAPGPLFIDYTSGAINFRRMSGKQLLLKAVGGAGKSVLDSTAGLGRDAFVLASLGCKVRALEKSTVLGELVLDALERCRKDQRLEKIVRRLEFSVGESSSFIKNISPLSYDALYIDPMFPESKKTALPKKEMLILQKFFAREPSGESDIKKIFDEGTKKFKRIVVKRPLNGPELASGVKVKFKGSSTRFDVYVFEN